MYMWTTNREKYQNVVCAFCVLHLCALQFFLSFLAYQATNILSSFVGFKFKQIKLEITFMTQLTLNKSDLETFDELESNCSEIRASASQSPPETSSSSCIVNISVRFGRFGNRTSRNHTYI